MLRTNPWNEMVNLCKLLEWSMNVKSFALNHQGSRIDHSFYIGGV